MKNLTTYLVIILLVCLTVSIMTCSSERNAGNRIATQLQDSTKHYKDLYGTEHARNTVVEAKVGELQGEYLALADTASKRAGIDKRKIEELTRVNMQLKGQYVTKWVHDTVNNRDGFSVGDSGIFKIDVWGLAQPDSPILVSFSANVDINLTNYWDRKWLLGAKTHYIDGYSTNPNIHITNLQHVQIVKEKPKVLAKIAFFALGVLGGVILAK